MISLDVGHGAAAMRSRSRPRFDAGIVNRLTETSLPIRTGSEALRPIGLDPSPLRSGSTARGRLLCSPTVRNDRNLRVVEVSAIGSPGRGGDAGFNVISRPANSCSYLHNSPSGLAIIASWGAEGSFMGRDKRVLSRAKTFETALISLTASDFVGRSARTRAYAAYIAGLVRTITGMMLISGARAPARESS